MKKHQAQSKTPRLLSREAFKVQVFARDGGKCVFCPQPAIDAHHILERKLFPDGGYYLENGASVCETDHWKCESTEYSVEEVRAACGITEPVLPPGFSVSESYDKWGNRIRADGTREKGPFFHEPGVQKVLARGGKLYLFQD